MSVISSGFSVRPTTGPYRCGNVRPGTRVAWRAATPILQIATAFDNHGVTAYIPGDSYHLRGCGDHTPWSTGKVYGRIFATDIMYPNIPKLQTWILGIMRGPTDTGWIDFININGSQYNAQGSRVNSSGDHHLHISATKGAVNQAIPTFIYELNRFLGDKSVALPLPPIQQPKSLGVFMALSDKEQEDLIYTMGIGAVAQKAGLRPMHVRVAELEKDMATMQATLNAILAEVKKP